MTTNVNKELISVANLRRMGLKVGVSHLRDYTISVPVKNGDLKRTKARLIKDKKFETKLEVCPRGGLTTVTITGLNGATVTGVAECSKQDNFNRRRGIKIAIHRAIKNAMENDIQLF